MRWDLGARKERKEGHGSAESERRRENSTAIERQIMHFGRVSVAALMGNGAEVQSIRCVAGTCKLAKRKLADGVVLPGIYREECTQKSAPCDGRTVLPDPTRYTQRIAAFYRI